MPYCEEFIIIVRPIGEFYFSPFIYSYQGPQNRWSQGSPCWLNQVAISIQGCKTFFWFVAVYQSFWLSLYIRLSYSAGLTKVWWLACKHLASFTSTASCTMSNWMFTFLENTEPLANRNKLLCWFTYLRGNKPVL